MIKRLAKKEPVVRSLFTGFFYFFGVHELPPVGSELRTSFVHTPVGPRFRTLPFEINFLHSEIRLNRKLKLVDKYLFQS